MRDIVIIAKITTLKMRYILCLPVNYLKQKENYSIKKLYEFVLFDEKLSVNDLFTKLMSNTDYDICELFTKFIYECYEKRKKITFKDH